MDSITRPAPASPSSFPRSAPRADASLLFPSLSFYVSDRHQTGVGRVRANAPLEVRHIHRSPYDAINHDPKSRASRSPRSHRAAGLDSVRRRRSRREAGIQRQRDVLGRPGWGARGVLRSWWGALHGVSPVSVE